MQKLSNYGRIALQKTVALFYARIPVSQEELEKALDVLYSALQTFNNYSNRPTRLLSVQGKHVKSPEFVVSQIPYELIVATSFVYKSLGIDIFELIRPLSSIEAKVELQNPSAEAIKSFENRRIAEMQIAQDEINKALNNYYKKAEKHMKNVVEAVKKLEAARSAGDSKGISEALDILRALKQTVAKSVNVIDLREALEATNEIITRFNHLFGSKDLESVSSEIVKTLTELHEKHEVRLIKPIFRLSSDRFTVTTLDVGDDYVAEDLLMAKPSSDISEEEKDGKDQPSETSEE